MRRRTLSAITRVAGGGTPRSGRAISAARSIPSASANSSSASSSGVSQPAARSASTAAASSGADELSRLELSQLLLGLERCGEVVEVAGEEGRDVVLRDVHPVVGDPVLGEVVGADLVGALAGADLGHPLRGLLGLLGLHLALEQPRPQDPHRLLPVLELGLLVLHGHLKP